MTQNTKDKEVLEDLKDLSKKIRKDTNDMGDLFNMVPKINLEDTEK